MELVSPAGNPEKLKYAYLFGADAAYIGISGFSLRAKADNFSGDDYLLIPEIKGKEKKLYCAANIFFHNNDIARFEESVEYISRYNFDGFIISDPGLVRVLKKYFPDTPLHLSTQANCLNADAAAFYRDTGFSRIVLGRELRLKEIEKIRTKVPDIKLEAFVHGAMCLAYSGRCFLSAYMADRSANNGDCAHACRWRYRLLEEDERRGEYFPVYEGDDYTFILSSKDICMIDHLKELQDAGIDAVKIEGRMKSVYYTAVATRAYRAALDALEKPDKTDPALFREELFKVSRRKFSTGFYFDADEVSIPDKGTYDAPYIFSGFVGKEKEPGIHSIDVKNRIRKTDTLEYVGYDILFLTDNSFTLYDENMNEVDKANQGKTFFLKTGAAVKEGYIIRIKTGNNNTDKESAF